MLAQPLAFLVKSRTPIAIAITPTLMITAALVVAGHSYPAPAPNAVIIRVPPPSRPISESRAASSTRAPAQRSTPTSDVIQVLPPVLPVKQILLPKPAPAAAHPATAHLTPATLAPAQPAAPLAPAYPTPAHPAPARVPAPAPGTPKSTPAAARHPSTPAEPEPRSADS